jgi:hypothetical protein
VAQQWPPRDKIVCGSMLDHIMSGSASRCLITQSRTPRSLSCLITQTRRHAVTQTCCLITQSRTPTSDHADTQTCCHADMLSDHAVLYPEIPQLSDHADTQTCCHADMLSDRAVSYPEILQPRVSRSHSLVSSPTARRDCAFNPDPAADSKSVPRMRRTDSERMRRKICKSVPRMRSDCTRPGLCLFSTRACRLRVQAVTLQDVLSILMVPSVLSLTLKGRGNRKWRN